MRSSPSVDRLLVDPEHGNTDDHSTHERGIAHCVRCGGDTVPDKRALASEAHGILVPVRVVARRDGCGVSYLKFAPRGKRGFEPLLAVGRFVQQDQTEATTREYLSRRMKGLLLQCRLRRRGVGGVDEIAAIDGVDVFLGRSIWRLRWGIEYGMSMTMSLWCNSTGLRSGRAKERREEGKAAGMYCDTEEQDRGGPEKGSRSLV